MSGRPTPVLGLRVLDVSEGIPGAYCTKMLADAGAEVVKVEGPGGDPLRRWWPPGGNPGAAGGLFTYLTAGKDTVSVNVEVPSEMLAWADVVVSGRPGRLGVDWAAVQAAGSRASLVSITPFGARGPWVDRPATDLTLQALCGAVGFRGFPEGAPVGVGGSVGLYSAGAYAAVAALASRWTAAAHYDVSILEAAVLSLQGYEWLHASLMGLEGFSRSVEVPSIEPAKDGWVGMSMVTGQQWQDFAAMIGQPVLAEEPQLCNQLGRWPRRQEVYDLVHPWLAERTVDEVVSTAQLYRIPMAPLGSGSTVRHMDHFVEREVFVTNPAGFEQPRAPWRMSECEPSALRTSSERTTGWPQSESRADPERTAPLAGLRVLDFTAFWAGPTASFVLAALGAEVTKVESVQRPDGIRFAGGPRPGAERWWEYSWIFHGVNPNKRDVTLNLNSLDGRDVALRLAAQADVAIENSSPRVMDAFGFTWERLQESNPGLVFARMPAFGLDGPWRDRVGFAPTMEQLSGMAWVTGHPDGPPMAPRGACDPIAGVHAAFAVLAALDHRRRTGRGQLVEVPMVEVALNLTADQVIAHQLSGEEPVRIGNRGEGAPQNVYRCAGDDRWLAVAVVDDGQWGALVELLGSPEWAADPALRHAAGRRSAHDVIDSQLGAWLAGRDVDETAGQLRSAGVPAEAVVMPPDVVGLEALQQRGFFEPMDHAEAGRQLYAGLPFPCPWAPSWCTSPPPLLGQHNAAVLADAGVDPEQMGRLGDSSVIGERPLGL